jgi:site-specific DNA recombinase
MAQHNMARHKQREMAVTAMPGLNAVKRCAIYTRKSTDEGLEQDFNSLQAQREACEAYVESQRHEGWTLIKTSYDDGGYSGGSMERPGLRALLADIDAGRIDTVVVYKVDRLTRALSDFAKMVDSFDRHAVSFVSVTQAFNTTTSMGRLTLNVLLSFAQFEREVGAERVRDKVAASRKKGMWMGGTVPQGYRVENRKLVVDPPEAKCVRLIFELYLTCGSTTALLTELNRRGVCSAVRVSQAGRSSGGVAFGTGSIDYLLHNRVYVGEVVHKGEVYPGEHDAILDQGLFDAVQQKLASQARPKRGRRLLSQSLVTNLLTGLIFDSNGNRMSPTRANKRCVRYRYYTSRALAEGRKADVGNPARVSAPVIEAAVLDAIRGNIDRCDTGSAIKAIEPPSDDTLVATHLRRVLVHPDKLMLEMSGSIHPASASDTIDPATEKETMAIRNVVVSWSPEQKRPKQVILEAGGTLTGNADADDNRRRLAHAIQSGRNWLAELASGSTDSIDHIAIREGKHLRTIRTTIALAFLEPDMTEQLISHGLPAHWTLSDVARRLPRLWSDQRKMLAN